MAFIIKIFLNLPHQKTCLNDIIFFIGRFGRSISYLWEDSWNDGMENKNMLQHRPRRGIEHGWELWRIRWSTVLLFRRCLDNCSCYNIFNVPFRDTIEVNEKFFVFYQFGTYFLLCPWMKLISYTTFIILVATAA